MGVELRRELGFFSLLMFGVGGLIGAGIFAISGFLVVSVGFYSVFVVVVAGLFALLSSFVYAEFSTVFPYEGGGYTFIRNSFVGRCSFLGGWIFFIAYVFGSVFHVFVLGRYLHMAFGFDLLGSIFVVVVFFLVLNVFSTRTSGEAEIFLVAVKVSLLLFVGVAIIALVSPSSLRNIDFSGFPSINSFVYLTTAMFIAFEGFDIVATAGDEVRNPVRVLPKAIIATTVIGIVMHTTITLSVYLASVVYPDVVSVGYESIIVVASQRVLGWVGVSVLMFDIIVALLSAYNATFFASARILYSMGRDGYLPKFFVKTGKRGVPERSLFVSSLVIIIIVIVMYMSYVWGWVCLDEISVVLGTLSSISFALAFGFVDFGLLVYRRKYGAVGKYRTPAYPWTPILGVIFAFITLIALIMSSIVASILFCVLIGIGVLASARKI